MVTSTPLSIRLPWHACHMNIDSELKMRMTMMMMVMMMMIMTAIRIMMNLNEEELGLSSKGGASVGCERLPNLHYYHYTYHLAADDHL